MECAEIMKRQGFCELTGIAKITSAYNLPCRYILHTVGPIVQGKVTEMDKNLLAGCYRSCLELAEKHGIKSIAFYRLAAEIAIQTVEKHRHKVK